MHHPIAAELARLSQSETARNPSDPPNAADKENPGTGATGTASQDKVVPERERYLVFRAGKTYAARVDDVLRIIEHPANVTPLHDEGNAIAGLFLLGTESIALAPLAPPDNAPGNHVLLVGQSGRQIGFVVDEVIGLRRSNWRGPPSPEDPEALPLVELRQGREKEVLPVIDLAARAEALTAA